MRGERLKREPAGRFPRRVQIGGIGEPRCHADEQRVLPSQRFPVEPFEQELGVAQVVGGPDGEDTSLRTAVTSQPSPDRIPGLCLPRPNSEALFTRSLK